MPKILTSSYLMNAGRTCLELRIYISRPLPLVKIPEATRLVINKFKEVGLLVNEKQLLLFSNRAGLHYYIYAEATSPLLTRLQNHKWRKSIS
jgi:hypothetical protein